MNRWTDYFTQTKSRARGKDRFRAPVSHILNHLRKGRIVLIEGYKPDDLVWILDIKGKFGNKVGIHYRKSYKKLTLVCTIIGNSNTINVSRAEIDGIYLVPLTLEFVFNETRFDDIETIAIIRND